MYKQFDLKDEIMFCALNSVLIILFTTSKKDDSARIVPSHITVGRRGKNIDTLINVFKVLSFMVYKTRFYVLDGLYM